MSDTVVHSQRIDLAALAPEAQKAMGAFGAAAGKDVDPVVAELVRIRVSQINGCWFCVDMHSEAARSAGESERRLQAVAAWREASVFTARERAALDLAEAATLLAQTQQVADDVWATAVAEFGEQELAQLVMVIAAINSWNRIAVTSRKQRS